MKIAELLDVAIKRNPDMGYDNEKGQVRGKATAYLDTLQATPEDVATALIMVKKSSEYKEIIELGMKDESSAAELKNGTINFEGSAKEKLYSGKIVDTRLRYKVLVNGKIQVIHENDFHNHPGKSPKPHIIPGKQAESICRTMTAAMAQLKGQLQKRMKDPK